MRYSTTLTKTMLHLFDAFGKIDPEILYRVPFLVTGETGSKFRCAVGYLSHGTIYITIVTEEGFLRWGSSYGEDVTVDITAEPDVAKEADRLSEIVARRAAKICEEEEYEKLEAYSSVAYDGAEITPYDDEDDTPSEWLRIAGEANRTVRDRFLSHLGPIPAAAIKVSSLTFRNLNLFSDYVMPPAAQESIIDAVGRIPAVIGPVLARKDFIEDLEDTCDVFESMASVFGASGETLRILALLYKDRDRDHDAVGPVIAAIPLLPERMLGKVKTTEIAENLWKTLTETVGSVLWAFGRVEDDLGDFPHQSRNIGAAIARIVQRGDILEDVIVRKQAAFEWTYPGIYTPFDDIFDLVLQTLVLPHLPEWMFSPDRKSPERSERLRWTVGANLLMWAGLREFGTLTEGWKEVGGRRLGDTRTPDDERELYEKCASFLERAMPGMSSTERAWALVSNLEALNALDSDGPRGVMYGEAAE